MFDTQEVPAPTRLPAVTTNLSVPGNWTEDRVKLLKELWLEGLSASQIAGALGEGVTRNGVIGKVHRLKLSGRAKPQRSGPRVRNPNRPARRVATLGRNHTPLPFGRTESELEKRAALSSQRLLASTEEEYVPPQVQELFIPIENRLTLLQVGEKTCKWPIGDPLTPDFYFCGQHPESGKPYCEFHSRRAYHQLEKKKRRL